MAHGRSAKKRIRQNETRRVRNRAKTSALRTELKKAQAALAGGDKGAVEAALRLTNKLLDRAAAKRLIHRNEAARRKSRLAVKAAKVLAGA